MLSLLIASCLLKHVQAAQVQPIISSPQLDSTANPTSDDLGDQRSVWNIIWTCLVTTFTCTWVAIHPNLPAPGDRRWTVVARRVKIMALGLLAPELIIFWALSQWISSRHFARKYKHAGWTVTHGFLLQMGGFVLHEGVDSSVLVEHELEEIYRSGDIISPMVTQEEIEDRSKGDMLSKSLVILQTSWFIVQCIARGAQGLAITEIEVATLGFAILNGVVYFLWWNKPVDVRFPVHVTRVYMAQESSATGDVGSIIMKDDWGNDNRTGEVDRYFKGMAKVLLPTYLWTVASRLGQRRKSRYPAKSEEESYNGDLRGFSTFYAAPLRITSQEDELRWIISAATAAMFGAVHCIAWSFSFVTRVEQIIWRISSLIIVCVPIYYVFYRFTLKTAFLGAGSLLQYPLRMVFIFALNIYILARIFLLVESIVALRSLPPGSYKVVHWTIFIPHL